MITKIIKRKNPKPLKQNKIKEYVQQKKEIKIMF